MHKQFLLTSILAVSMAGLFADQPNSGQGKNGQKPQMQQREITPQAEPVVKRWADPFITAEFIWWRASQAGLGYAFSGVAPAAAGAAPVVEASTGRVKTPKFKYEPGFKVGFGVKSCHDGWDIYARYTWLQEHNVSSKLNFTDADSLVQSNFTFPEGNNGDVTVFPTEAQANWRFNFNVLDLELGRNFYVSRYVTLRPFTGLKFAWFRNRLNLENEAITATAPAIAGIAAGGNIYSDMKQHMFGVGIRAGINSVWYMAKHWGIYGDFAATALWSDYKIKRVDTTQTALANVDSFNVKYKEKTITPVIELGLGLRYDTTFHNDDFMFMLQAGWEEQIYMDQLHFFDAHDRVNENLTVQGLTIKAGLYF